MKLLKAALAVSGLGTTTLPTTVSLINIQPTLLSSEKQDLELLELSSFENLFNNVVNMVENNIFWDENKVSFDHWKDATTDDIKEKFYDTIPALYQKYFDNQMCALTTLRVDMSAEREVKTYKSHFINASNNPQEWTTPGYEEVVSNSYSYSVTKSEVHQAGVNISAKFWGIGVEAEYNYTNENGTDETIENTIEKTETYPPQAVNVSPNSAGEATYRITQGHGIYQGMMSTINTPPFELKIPPFFSTKGQEIKIVLRAKNLLKGLDKAGYNLRLIGKGATKFSVLSYDDTKSIEETERLTFNIPMDWEADTSRIWMEYKELPL